MPQPCGADWFTFRPYQLTLDEDTVRKIKQRLVNRTDPYRVIGEEFGVSIAMVWKIDHGRSWKHVKIDNLSIAT